MSARFTDDEIKIELRLRSAPLVGLKETEQEWWLGSLSLSKHAPSFRVGFGQALGRGAAFFKQWFEVGGLRGWAIGFRSPGEVYFTGWVPPAREGEADRWIEFLNEEIEKRHVGIDSRGIQPGSKGHDLRGGTKEGS